MPVLKDSNSEIPASEYTKDELADLEKTRSNGYHRDGSYEAEEQQIASIERRPAAAAEGGHGRS